MDIEALAKALDGDIHFTHERFLTAMQGRLPEMPSELKQQYFTVLSALVGKLETPDKSLPQILQEMVAETTPLILMHLGSLPR